MKLFSPAKINLFLRVTGKRPDGYHDLFTLMCLVSLYDILHVDFDCSGIHARCSHPDVPEDETNLAYRAGALFFQQLARTVPKLGETDYGISIRIEKKIPVGGGLGGGSSNAATILTSLNRHFQGPFSTEELIQMGQRLGADVPFFILGKPAIARGIGEQLETYANIPKYHVLLVCPNFSVSTARVYKNLNLTLTKCEKKLKYPIFKMQGFRIGSHLCNDLETVTLKWHPEISEAKRLLMAHGADGALMSGSGGSVFGLFKSSKKARDTGEKMAGKGNWQIFVADILF